MALFFIKQPNSPFVTVISLRNGLFYLGTSRLGARILGQLTDLEEFSDRCGDVVFIRNALEFENSGIWHRHVEARHASEGGVQIVEAVFLNPRRDFRA